ncbi:MAG: TIGR00266 family protein [Planctomycetes bacterium]|nr:TIGR00266 family protein [Planctomycetota bacterium]
MASSTLNYRIEGDDFQALFVHLQPAATMRAEPGSFMFMEPGIQMDTSTGGGIMAGLKRAIGGESFFITTFRNEGSRPATVAFAAAYPGKMIVLDLSHGTVLCQRDAFLCSTTDVDVSVAFTRKLGAGFFGGEGFILQKLQGTGQAFLHAGGYIIERELANGEELRVDTGCLVAFEASVDYDIQMVRGIKTMLFGGEGLFYALLRGPGKIWMQTTPFSRFADKVMSAAGGGSERVQRGGNFLGGILQGE